MIKIFLNKKYSGEVALLQTLKDHLNKSISVNISKDVKKIFGAAVSAENLKIQIFVEKNVTVNFVDDLYLAAVNSCDIEFILRSKSSLNYLLKFTDSKNLNNKNVIRNIKFSLVEPNCRVKAKVLLFGQKNQNFKFKTIQNHRASKTYSNLNVKGVFKDKSELFCENLIKVEKNLKDIDSKQVNKNILIGKSSHTISIPKFEIESDDVKCNHGSATSRLNKEHIFYLQSRGFTKDLSKELLIYSFLK